MVNHIYGRINLIVRTDRPHMFIKELTMYVDFLKKKVEEISKTMTDKQIEYFITFRNNLLKGIEYYKNMFTNVPLNSGSVNKLLYIQSLEMIEKELNNIIICKFKNVQMCK